MKSITEILGAAMIMGFFLFMALFFISCASNKICKRVCAPDHECVYKCKPESEWLN